jgi:hypothetical protein
MGERAGERGPAETATAAETQDGATQQTPLRGWERGPTRIGYAPITRVDIPRREIELCATSEAIDSHGTIFDYEASKDAFTRWIGNVREMHDRRAIGSRVSVHCDDEVRKVFVRVRISRGAGDTWEKVLDGTLRGASIGAANVTWARQERSNGGQPRWLPVATHYDLVELSLVDNPSNPDALGITVVRDAVPDPTLLDMLDADGGDADAPVTGAGRIPAVHTIGRAPEPPDGDARQPFHVAARSILAGCGCLGCVAAVAAHGEEGELAMRFASASATEEGALVRAMAAGLAASATHLERMEGGVRGVRALVEALSTQVGTAVEGLRARIETLEAQPLPGGPVGYAGTHAIEKTHALAPRAAQPIVRAEQLRALESLAGHLGDPQAQIAVAAEIIRLREGG